MVSKEVNWRTDWVGVRKAILQMDTYVNVIRGTERQTDERPDGQQTDRQMDFACLVMDMIVKD